jgi:hypothetical protein
VTAAALSTPSVIGTFYTDLIKAGVPDATAAALTHELGSRLIRDHGVILTADLPYGATHLAVHTHSTSKVCRCGVNHAPRSGGTLGPRGLLADIPDAEVIDTATGERVTGPEADAVLRRFRESLRPPATVRTEGVPAGTRVRDVIRRGMRDVTE